MNKSAIAVAFALCLMNSPALSRAPPRSGITTCEGRIEVSQYSNPGWYRIDDCSFEGNTRAGKAILDACGVGSPCRIRAYGVREPDFYVKRVISVQRIGEKDLSEIPEQYRGTWILYFGHEDSERANNTKENRMPVGSKGIGWLKGLCDVTGVKTNDETAIVEQSCAGRGKVTELWALRKLNGAEMLIVATIGGSSPAVTPKISLYVRDVESRLQ